MNGAIETVREEQYEQALKRVYDQISHHFGRTEPRRRAWAYLRSLPNAYSEGRRNGQQFAKYPGERRADGVQRLLTSAQWDEDKVRDELRMLILKHGGSTGGAFFVSEVSFPKKGSQSVAVERQYSADIEKHENCQIGVVLFYFTANGCAFVLDRELYLPQSWADDAVRRSRAGIPEGIDYRSKSMIAAGLIARVVRAGIVPKWVGSSLLCPETNFLQRILQQNDLPHFISASRGEIPRLSQIVASFPHPTRRAVPHSEIQTRTETSLIGRHRLIRIPLAVPAPSGFDCSHIITISGDRGSNGQSHYFGYTWQGAQLTEIGPMINMLGNAKEYCRRAKQEIGLGSYEVRSWRGWYRHVTLAMAARTAMELARSPQYVRQARW